jgi:DNA-binding NarL/FixJ family response regulator
MNIPTLRRTPSYVAPSLTGTYQPAATTSNLIRVLVAEDHAIVREGLCGLLEVSGRFVVVGQARTGREAVDMARKLLPDVIVMDIGMPELNGIQATQEIMRENPKARVLILSGFSDDLHVERVTEVGAAGFLEKQSSASILTEAIREVAEKRQFISPSIAKRIRARQKRREATDGLSGPDASRITPRESEALQLLAEGLTNKQIAGEMRISIKTVEKHRQKVMNKLNIHGTALLTRYAIESGITQSCGDLKIA